jgi:LytS/YehU family sensor histidine kinase
MMNPHFIFNVMNSIQNYINNNQNHEANLFLSDFATLIRVNLDISSKRYISLDDEIAYLELYLALESRRFNGKLTYKIDIAKNVDGDDIMVPVMLIQPFVENAIWHGILPKKQPGNVTINISAHQTEFIKIEIIDDGVGLRKPNAMNSAEVQKHISKGMKMTRERLDLISQLSGKKLDIVVTEAFPGSVFPGVKVEFLLPNNLQ